MALDYTSIQQALADLMPLDATKSPTSSTGFKKVFQEAQDRDLILDLMPCCNVRLDRLDRNITSIPDGYYNFLFFEIDVISYHLRDFKAAAIIRENLLRLVEDAVMANRQFHVDIATSRLGDVRFGIFSPEGAGGHIAVATLTVIVEADLHS